MTSHLSRLLILAAFALTAVACGDDTVDKPSDNTCSAGEVFNPVTGGCQPRMGANNGMPMPDMTVPNNGTPTDMGSNNGVPVDMPLSPDCQAAERRCNGEVVEVCVDGLFEASQTCTQGLVCERGNCIPEDSGDCTPGATRCASQTSTETCQADGQSWAEVTSCEMGATCSNGVCATGCAGLIDEKSNVGCEYISMRHNQASGLQVLAHSVVVSNPGDMSVTVTVTSPGGINPGIPDQTIAPLDSAILTFPKTPMVNANGLSSNIYVIRSSRPVIATQFAPLNNPGIGSETSDASLLLPTNAVGQEYVVLGWRALQPGGTYVDIVALEPGTMVNVESPTPLSGGAAGSVAENSSQTFTIPENQVLHLAENRGFFSSKTRDVSGVKISSNKPVAVYTGGTIINIPDTEIRVNPPAGCVQNAASCIDNSACCSGVCGYNRPNGTYECMDSLAAGDHVEQQLFPVETWGTSYVASPFPNRNSNDFTIYRVAGATDGTTVTLNPPVNGETTFTLNDGEYRQIYSPDPFELTATNPVMVAQFMIGGSISATDDGDPAFLIPPAIQQYRDSYVFLVPGQYRNNYVTLIKKTGTAITLDGTAVSQTLFQAIGSGSQWEIATWLRSARESIERTQPMRSGSSFTAQTNTSATHSLAESSSRTRARHPL